MIRVWILNAFLLISSLTVAQVQRELSHSMHGQTTPVSIQRSFSSSSIDTLRLLAIMVDFQVDADEQTTGDGTFQLSGSAAQIDPPPHDSIYFKNKIRFVENYFHNVSNELLTIQGTVLDQRISLPKVMKEYAPPTTGNDNRKLAQLALDSWRIADSLFSAVDFSRYDLFVIFHAGAGRDIDLVSSLGYNPTPYDIPSLYLDSTAFATALGGGSFLGIPVHGGSIKNTIILPETESRVLAGESIELGINGLFAASIGSYLGLPDLFDTKTGRSGIGRFGLMDGASIFAYGGLFPTEPSAWEKIRLGWVNPKIVESVSSSLFLPAVGLANATKDSVSIYKVPISQSEYFLLENRNRDPERNGQRLTIVQDGRDTVQYFGTDVQGFRNDDVSGIHGSVVDVEDFDWAMVGTFDGTSNYDGGGILIWHIDENVIQSGLKTNTVNADRKHRGVDLMEADGSKDIGQNYDLLEPGYGTENGSPLDCWFNGNSAALYRNVFDRHSFPNSNSTSGAASLITIWNFSIRSPRMEASVEIGNPVLKKDFTLSSHCSAASGFPTSTGSHLYLPTTKGLFEIYSDGQTLVKDSMGIFPTATTIGEVAVCRLPGLEIMAGVQDSTLYIFRIDSLNAISSFTRKSEQRFTTSPCFAQLDSLIVLVGTESGSMFRLNINDSTISTRPLGSGSVSSIAQLPLSVSKNEYYCSVGDRIYGESAFVDLPASSNSWILAGAVSPKGNYIAAAERNGNRILSFHQSLSKKNFEITVAGSAIQELAIADLNGDGEKDIIVQATNCLSVYSRIGNLLDGFPIKTKGSLEYSGTPLIVDFNGDGQLEIILFTNDGTLSVYDRNGILLSGFPVQVASPGKVYPTVYSSPANMLGIAILSEKDSLAAFLTTTSVTQKSLAWWQHLGDEKHTSTEWTPTTFVSLTPEFLPKSRVYNWPNPVYGRTTQIRYYTSEDAAVTITILDLSGVKITELKGRGIGGLDNEIVWDVSNIQSGVYLARIDAQGLSKSEVAIIKIAVVK